MIKITKEVQLIIQLSNRLDATNAEAAKELIEGSINNIDRDALIDVSELNYISSAGLQVILLIAKASKAAGKECFLRGAKNEVREIFKLSGFLTFIKEIK